MSCKTPSPTHWQDQLRAIAKGLGQTLAPFGEVVLHDLTDPEHAILDIYNPLSNRSPGDPVTNLGLARIADSDTPQVIANYANRFADGRPAKSTSIGIKDENGRYIAALCINLDISMFRGLKNLLAAFDCAETALDVAEDLAAPGHDIIRTYIDTFAVQRGTSPQGLKTADRRALIQDMKAKGYLEVRHAVDTIVHHLGVSRATVYSDAK